MKTKASGQVEVRSGDGSSFRTNCSHQAYHSVVWRTPNKVGVPPSLPRLIGMITPILVNLPNWEKVLAEILTCRPNALICRIAVQN